MILVTVGTIQFPFKRMNSLVEKLAQKYLRQEIVYQHGETPVSFKIKNVRLRKYLSHQQHIESIKKSRFIICHGGPATIFLCNLYGKIPVTLARESGYNEHVNDHQVFFCRFMHKRRLVHNLSSEKDERILLSYMNMKQGSIHIKISAQRKKLTDFLDASLRNYS